MFGAAHGFVVLAFTLAIAGALPDGLASLVLTGFGLLALARLALVFLPAIARGLFDLWR